MEKKYLIINTGSASKKYALYLGTRELLRAHFETEGKKFVVAFAVNGKTETSVLAKKEFENSLGFLIDFLGSSGLLTDTGKLSAVALRIVAPGTYFTEHRQIDAAYLKKLKNAEERAPLHIEPVLDEIALIKKLLPRTPLFGISDSAYHATMPDLVKRYSLPKKISAKLDIFRFGYHGISFQSVVRKSQNILGQIPEKMIVCHLGSGVSITAIKNGKSIDTSMGFTPLEGVPMGTRIGNIDPGAITYIAQKLKMSPAKLENLLNTECGLLGLSGKTADVRELIALAKKKDKNAIVAMDSFAYNIKKYVGAYMAALGGLDLLVFTATIGERSPIMRERILSGLEHLGVIIDKKKNSELISADGLIHSGKSPVKIAVLLTDELQEMARIVSGEI